MTSSSSSSCTSMDTVFNVGEYVAPVILITTLSILLKKNKISKATFAIYFVGVSLGLLWEYTHAFIPGFIKVSPCVSKYIPEKTLYPLLHALFDGGIFLLGYLACVAIFKSDFQVYKFAIFMFLFSAVLMPRNPS